MKALKRQLKFELEKNCNQKKLQTIFIGGGTPSCIKASKYQEIFEVLDPYIDKNCEITTEANPNSASLQWQQQMRNLGVNRISFGVQSFNEEKLKFLGRSHNKNSAIEAINNAKKVGFDSINCDIIYGVHKDTFESLKYDFNTIKDLKIDHLSAYSLTIEEGTKFFHQTKVKIDDEELSQKIFQYLNQLGFTQYEISNFSTNTKYQSKHNFGYWQHKNYLGVGSGAVGFINDYRYYSQKDVAEYIANPTQYEVEKLSQEDIKVEKILLGLRCSNGFEVALLNDRELKRVNELVLQGKLRLENDRVYNLDFLLADELALFVLE